MQNANTPHEADSKLPGIDTARSLDAILLRSTALIFFFRGLFSFVRTILSPLRGDFFLDPRIIDVFIALGLVARKQIWYILAIISASVSLFWHIFSMVEYAASSSWIVLYFLLALVIDVFQLYTLLRKKTQAIYFIAKDKQ